MRKVVHRRWTVVVCWMECVTLISMRKILHSMWRVLFCVEWSVLQWTVCGKYCTAGGQSYCGLSGGCYSEQYVEGTAQQVDSSIVGWMQCVTVNSMWKLLHRKRTVLLCVEWSVFQWTLCASYCRACGHFYCRLNGACYSEQYVEGTAQQVEGGIVGWLECVRVDIMWKVLQSRWAEVLCFDCVVLQWTVCGRYYTAGWQLYCGLNGVCYSEQCVKITAKMVGSNIVGLMLCDSVNITWKLLHSSWIVVFWIEWNVLQWRVFGKYCTAGGQWYCGLNGVCYSEQWVEATAMQVDSLIMSWMLCVTLKIMWKLLHCRWRVLLLFKFSVLQ